MNLTIKQMLVGLVLIGVVVVLALSLTSIYSNIKLINSQNRLTEIALPLERAHQEIEAAVAAFIVRQGQIAGVKTLEELEQFAERQHLELAFEKGRERLKMLSIKIADVDQEIERLTPIYGKFLEKDSAVLESVRNSLTLENDIAGQLETLDKVGTELQKNAEAISGKINLATMRQNLNIRKYINEEEKTEELHEAIMELVQGDTTKTQKACNELRLAVSSLSTYGRQLLLVRERDSIASIEANNIAQAARLVEMSLETLKQGVTNSTELQAIVQTIDENFLLLKSTLVEADNSVAVLRSQWFVEQENLNALHTSLQESVDSITASLDSLQLLTKKIRDQAEKEATWVRKTAERIIGVVGIVAVLFMVITGTLITRRIIIPIKKAVSFAHTISTGDFTAKIQLNQKDEIGDLVSELSNMADSLNSLVGQVQQSGIQVTSSATELAATAKQQEVTMKNQVESTNKVVESVKEISDVVTNLVDTMQQVATMSQETAGFASSGQADLSRMEEAMQQMEDASKSISGRLGAINEKAENITTVVITITKVADQTNLLSLNAAIEAEKAGEYGRGFTVVAREIRRLADQTAVATLDIEQMVQEMQSAVSAGVMEMDKFIAEVRRSAEDVEKISTQLTRIIEQVQALSPSFENVNVAMGYQSEHAQKINNTMINLSEEMQQTAESLRESFLAIGHLNEAAKSLQDEVSRFKL